jgi:glycerol uptake facilitator-like aquaporin
MEYGLPDIKSSGRVYATVLFFEFIGSAVQIMAFNYSFNNYFVRAATYFFTWIIASTISGAHFNPAVSLAVYLAQRKYRKLFPYLIVVYFF